MTPDEALYRELFMQECWPTVREWNTQANEPRTRQVRADRKQCPHCRIVYAATYLRTHIRRIHPVQQAIWEAQQVSPNPSTSCAETSHPNSALGRANDAA